MKVSSRVIKNLFPLKRASTKFGYLRLMENTFISIFEMIIMVILKEMREFVVKHNKAIEMVWELGSCQ